MSLKESWERQRQQRQQEVAQRQKGVQRELVFVKQQRQLQAAHLRDELSLFRESLTYQDRTRRAQFQPFRVELQQFYANMQTEVQSLLSTASDRRQAQTKETAQQLDAFVQKMQQEISQFLSETTAERSLMAQQLERDLSLFIEALRSDVQSYLSELATIRQVRAETVQNELMQSRIEREAKVKAMFRQFAEFRAELNHFCTALRNEVWNVERSPSIKAVVVEATVAQQESKPTSKSSVSSETRLAGVGVFQQGQSIAVVPAKADKPAAKESIAFEKEVYNYIHANHGARLTQIESSLSINRFQAVDALRSLIKKGLITQRDRIYITQEDFAHV